MAKNKTRKPDVSLRSKLKKDPGVPRLPTLKTRNVEKQRIHPHPGPHHPDPDAVMALEPTISSLAALASSASTSDLVAGFNTSSEPQSEKSQTQEQQRRHYVRALHRVIDESDIVMLVLDARDPEGCRSRLVEEEVRRRESEGKRLVFVLNKIDLVPKDNAQAWLRYLRHTTPTLPFRSASNTQRNNLSSATAPALMRLLKAYKPSQAHAVTVGVVGYPNVGKSSLINTLKRSKVCAVAAQPGHTKELQKVQLERGLKIVDSPGVVFDDADEQFDSAGRSRARGSVLLRNVVRVEDVEDPIALVEDILVRTEPEVLMKIYDLPSIDSTLEFLTMLALTTGRLLKGGTPDTLAAARVVLRDWNQHKIPFFSVPPTIHPSSMPALTSTGEVAPGAETIGQARIIGELGKAFELSGLFQGADKGAFGEAEGNDMAMDEEEGKFVPDKPDEMDADVPPTLSNKRPRSPSPTPAPTESSLPTVGGVDEPRFTHRMPKRLRRSHDIPDYNAPVHAAGLHDNPLNRRMLKKAAKKARRSGRAVNTSTAGGGMEVDDEGTFSLGGTFFAGMTTELLA